MEWLQQLGQTTLGFFQTLYKTKLFELDDGEAFTLGLFIQLIFYAGIAYIIGSLISRLISKTILSRFKIDRGTKEAISSVIGYLIAGIGFVIVLTSAGIDSQFLNSCCWGVGYWYRFRIPKHCQ